MVSRAELTRMGRMGFSDEDYAEWLKRTIARRKDIQAHETALARMGEAGATERVKLGEAGAKERLGIAQEFERPEQVARIGEVGARTRETGARAAGEEYELGFYKSNIETIKSLLEQSKRLGELDIKGLEAGLRKVEPEVSKKVTGVATPTVPAVAGVAKPEKRRLRPWIRREVFGGPGAISPLASAAYGYRNIGDWLKHFARKGYEYAYPRSR